MVASWKSSSLAKLLVERHGYQRTSSRASGGRPRRQRQKASGVICSHSTRSAVTDPIKDSVPTCQRALPRQPARRRIVKVCRQPARRRIVKISACRRSPLFPSSRDNLHQRLPLRACSHYGQRRGRQRRARRQRGRRQRRLRRGQQRKGQPKRHAVQSVNVGCAKKASARSGTRLRVPQPRGGVYMTHRMMRAGRHAQRRAGRCSRRRTRWGTRLGTRWGRRRRTTTRPTVPSAVLARPGPQTPQPPIPSPPLHSMPFHPGL